MISFGLLSDLEEYPTALTRTIFPALGVSTDKIRGLDPWE